MLGNWGTNYDTWLSIDKSEVDIFRGDGKLIAFYYMGGVLTGPSDFDIQLTHTGSKWTLRDEMAPFRHSSTTAMGWLD